MGNGEWAGGLVSVTIYTYQDSSLALRMTGPAGEWGCEKMFNHFFTAPNHRNAVLLMNPKAASRPQPEADCFRLCMQ